MSDWGEGTKVNKHKILIYLLNLKADKTQEINYNFENKIKGASIRYKRNLTALFHQSLQSVGLGDIQNTK